MIESEPEKHHGSYADYRHTNWRSGGNFLKIFFQGSRLNKRAVLSRKFAPLRGIYHDVPSRLQLTSVERSINPTSNWRTLALSQQRREESPEQRYLLSGALFPLAALRSVHRTGAPILYLTKNNQILYSYRPSRLRVPYKVLPERAIRRACFPGLSEMHATRIHRSSGHFSSGYTSTVRSSFPSR